MGGINSDSKMESDLDLNRGLCAYLLGRLNEALTCLETSSEETALPGWVDRLFGGKDGLIGAYIRLSQQQLRIAAMQAESEKGMDGPEHDAPLTEEDIKLARAALERWEAQEKEVED